MISLKISTRVKLIKTIILLLTFLKIKEKFSIKTPELDMDVIVEIQDVWNCIVSVWGEESFAMAVIVLAVKTILIVFWDWKRYKASPKKIRMLLNQLSVKNQDQLKNTAKDAIVKKAIVWKIIVNVINLEWVAPVSYTHLTLPTILLV